jgi:hypothetical protein
MRLAEANAATRSNAEAAVVPSLEYDLDRLRNSFDPHPVTVKTLPSDLVRDWVSPDGQARAEAPPKGNANDSRVLKKFATAVLAAEPSATGPAVSRPNRHRRLHRSWRPRACCHYGPTSHRVAAPHRCTVDADTVAARRCCHARDMCSDRLCVPKTLSELMT